MSRLYAGAPRSAGAATAPAEPPHGVRRDGRRLAAVRSNCRKDVVYADIPCRGVGAKRLVFTGTFVVPSRCCVRDGRLVIADGPVAPKFLADVEQRTFSGPYAAAAGQPVLYVTERCVFELTADGLELTEIAPWLDLEKDILAHIGFEPIIRGEPKLMDARIFAAEPMGLKDDLLTMPLEARFAYDAGRNIFFLNMEGMSLVSAGDVQAIGTEVGKRLAVIGKKVQMVINYDNFYLDPALADDYKP
jgi:propionate CoA-transferase